MKFSQSIPKIPQENDRVELKEGQRFSITGVIISTQTRYGKVAKINGTTPNGQTVKYYTTAKVIVKSCEDMLLAQGLPDGRMREPVDVEVKKVMSSNKQNYLTFADQA